MPKGVMKWSPPGRSKLGRPKLTWWEGIRGLLGGGKAINGRNKNDKGNWRKKIIQLSNGRRKMWEQCTVQPAE